MKKLLLKYLKSKNEFNDLITEIKNSNLPDKALFDFVLENTNDTFIKSLYNVVNVGVYESIENLKKTTTYQDINLKTRLLDMQKNVKLNEDSVVLPHYLNTLKQYLYEPIFKKEYEKITAKLDENQRIMTLSYYYLNLDNNKMHSKKIDEAKEVLFDLIVKNNEVNEAKFLNITEDITYNKDIVNVTKFLCESKANLNSKLANIQKDFVIQNVTGIFEQINENEFIIHAEKRDLILNEAEGFIKDLDKNNTYTLTNEYKNLSKMLDKDLISISEVINIYANKIISINDSDKKVFIDGKEITLVENDISFTLVTKYGINKKYIPMFEYIMENTDKFVSFDNAKKIQHIANKDLNVIIFKLNESLFSFKNNNKIGKKFITEIYEPSELRTDVKNFINFDIKENMELFESLFINEAQNNKRKKEILAQIDQLEIELDKIENAEENEELEDDSIDELKNIITTKINDLRKEYVTVTETKSINKDYIEIYIDKNKKEVFYVKALDYTQAGKNDKLTVKNKNGKEFEALKKDIIIIEESEITDIYESGNPIFLNVNDIAKKLGINKRLVTFQNSYDGDKDDIYQGDIYQKMDVFNIDCSSYTGKDDSEIMLQILDGKEFMFIDGATEIGIKGLHTKKEIDSMELNLDLIPLSLSELNNKVFKQVVNSYIEANE